jgi:D-beta-D-heptose 7-phosphate kinase/D-beta-D-heptose 1-phosphate adenosyltransferase
MVAGIAVGRNETALCSVGDLRARLTETPATLDRDGLIDWIAQERARGRRIVFTNGCFDIIHSGHTSFLREARSLGDVLIVGLNSDESVTRLKGPGRPINSLTERASVLASLGSVDYVAPFEEDTPEALIEIVRPEIFVKGGDYRREELPEAPLVEALGGTVRILRYVEDHSTTGIINRISSTVAMG